MRILKATILAVIAIALFPETAAARKDDCIDWCQRNPDTCVKCKRTKACGAGHEVIAEFKEGANWYACGINNAGIRCETWCEANRPPCTHCSTSSACGPNYTRIDDVEPFRQSGFNTDWYACRSRRSDLGGGSEENRINCDNWCNSHDDCVRCSTRLGCGGGLDRLKSFTEASGTNWHACGRRHRSCCPYINDFQANAVYAGNHATLDAEVTFHFRGDSSQSRCKGTYKSINAQGVPGDGSTRIPEINWSDDNYHLHVHYAPFPMSEGRNFRIFVYADEDMALCPLCEGGGSPCASARDTAN